MDQPSPSAQPPELTLGAHYYVQRGEDLWHVAEIIQKREVEGRTEFYVHYKECMLPLSPSAHTHTHTHTNQILEL